MALSRDSFRLFGIDLASALDYLRAGWSEALRWRAFAWLDMAEPVRVLRSDGTSFVFSGGERLAAEGREVRASAVELPESMVLRRVLRLPQLSPDQLEGALALEAKASSPFVGDDLAWGYRLSGREGSTVSVELALASRAQVLAHLGALPALRSTAETEVWAAASPPIILSGFGEGRRQIRQMRARRRATLLLVLVLVALAALILSPAVQAMQRAGEARLAYQRLAAQAAPQIELREKIVGVAERLARLRAELRSHTDPLPVLAELTRQLPDDTVLNRLDLKGGVLRISGQASDAAALMKSLGSSPMFRDVRAPSASARAPGSAVESFTIELSLDAGVQGG